MIAMETPGRQLDEPLIEKPRVSKHEYREDIRDRATLELHFREKFQSLDHVRPTDGGFQRRLDEIITPDVLTASRPLLTRTLCVLSGLEDAECVDGTSDPLPTSDIGRIVDVYRQWRGEPKPAWWDAHCGTSFQPVSLNQRQDAAATCAFTGTPGFARPATIDEIAMHGHVLTPGRYVGAEAIEEDAEPFTEKYPRLVEEVQECLAESERLTNVIRAQPGRIEHA